MELELVLRDGMEFANLGEACKAVSCLNACRKKLEEQLKLPSGTVVATIPAHCITIRGVESEEWICKQIGIPTDIMPRQPVYFRLKADEADPKRRFGFIEDVVISQKGEAATVELMFTYREDIQAKDYQGIGVFRILKCQISQQVSLGPVKFEWVAQGEWEEGSNPFEFSIDKIHVGSDPGEGW